MRCYGRLVVWNPGAGAGEAGAGSDEEAAAAVGMVINLTDCRWRKREGEKHGVWP